MIVWLTLLMISEPPQPDVSGAVYNIARDMERMQTQMTELRAMMNKILEQRGCVETEPGAAKTKISKVEPPPPPAEPPAVPTPAVIERGTISGRVALENASAKIAYVYVADVIEPPVKALAEIRQKGKKFKPDHLVVRAGTRIEFPNDDNEHHHVFSAGAQNRFDLGYIRKGDATPSQLFAVPGLVDVNCNVHPLMNATVLVVPNRHWTKVGADGSFTLAGVRTGKHTLRAWGPGTALAEQSVTVHRDRVEPVVLKLEPKKTRQGVYP